MDAGGHRSFAPLTDKALFMKKRIVTLLKVFCAPLGLFAQLNVATLNTPHLIDFDNTVTGVNHLQWGGGVFNSNVGSMLNSGAWAFEGFSDGQVNFGGSGTSGDYYHNPTTGLPTAGGLYPFGIGGVYNNRVLGIRPSSDDFTPGSITLRLINTTGSTIDQVGISYDICIRNDKDISTAFNLSYSEDNNTYTAAASQDYATPAASGSTTWITVHRDTVINVAWLNNDFFYFRWTSDSVAGAGTGLNLGDVIALDNISITATSGSPLTVVAVDDSTLCLAATAGDSVFVDYDATVTYSSTNVFSVELSDPAGAFTNPVVIGSLVTSAATGTIGCHIPPGTAPGTQYHLRVLASDSTGYSVPSAFAVVISELPGLSAGITNIDCHGQQDGAIDLNATGGYVPYGFLWSSADTSEDIGNIPGGYYSVTASDLYGCAASLDSIFVHEPQALILDAVITESLCHGDHTGAVDLSVSGGMTANGNYVIQWSNGQSTEDVVNLAPGVYNVTVSDSLGCTADTAIQLSEPEELAFSSFETHLQCFEGADGKIQLFITGGVSPYDVFWSEGSTGPMLLDAAAGTYAATVTDANGCEDTRHNMVLTQPDSLQVAFAVTKASCMSCPDGEIQSVVAGGVPPYQFLWSNGAPSKNIDGLVPATYTLSVTDANDCVTIYTIEVETTVGTGTALHGRHGLLSVFPNPVQSRTAVLKAAASSPPKAMWLTNALGACIPVQYDFLAEYQWKLDLGEAGSGVYYLHVLHEDGSQDAAAIVIAHSIQ